MGGFYESLTSYEIANLPYHLHCAGKSKHVERLLFDLGWLRTKLRIAGARDVISDFQFAEKNPATERLASALRLSEHILKS